MFTRFRPADTPPPPLQIEYGEPNAVLDGIGRVVGLPARILTLNERVNKHDISPETIEELTTYLERNDLTDVIVYVNRYAPGDQWRLLRENTLISPGWKYTFGTLGWLHYTLMPTRIFGGDNYNPYTNTLTISSDHPSALLSEAAYAKQIREMRYPGPYAALTGLPGFALIRYTRATSDVLGYARTQGSWENEKEAYELLYPQLGISATAPPGMFLDFLPGLVVSAGGAVVGHGAAWYAVRQRERELASDGPSPESDDATIAEADPFSTAGVRDKEQESGDIESGAYPVPGTRGTAAATEANRKRATSPVPTTRGGSRPPDRNPFETHADDVPRPTSIRNPD
jgi:hypothetical protein